MEALTIVDVRRDRTSAVESCHCHFYIRILASGTGFLRHGLGSFELIENQTALAAFGALLRNLHLPRVACH
jgi:hypothetical protein